MSQIMIPHFIQLYLNDFADNRLSGIWKGLIISLSIVKPYNFLCNWEALEDDGKQLRAP